ncbi:GmrSD restriction endonuclease domain-containing protein [Paenibacillus paridis]|uniref:GmrSD restriction endonuclease domain-containing protein n=1 Tax=Paenibacillus paridis TaxID=2583376 RepID=UPI001122EF8B|nr:DUF262 domain-containing protein [Paenibacillus paridis]
MDTLKDKLSNLQKTAKERTVKTQNIEYDLETLVKKIKKNIIKLDPEYQRNHRWNNDISSRLIESLILNIPIPTIYISQDVDVDLEIDEDEIARYSVIDGQQRLTAINNYMTNSYPLSGLSVLDDLNGTFYKDLPTFLTRRLEERTVKCLRIDSTVDSQVKYDIFERLNTGAVKLEPQELRNAVCRGPFNDLIKKLAKNNDFRDLLQIDTKNPEENTKVKKMEDVELVLRFFALGNDNYLNYRKGFKQFLTDEMEKLNKEDSNKLKDLEDVFIKTMSGIKEYFGNLAFAKYKKQSGVLKKVSNFNSAVYDALAISFSSKVNLDNPSITAHTVEEYKELFKSTKFFDSVTGSVNDREKIIQRIGKVKEVFR